MRNLIQAILYPPYKVGFSLDASKTKPSLQLQSKGRDCAHWI